MTFNHVTGTFERIWKFVDTFGVGDKIKRDQLDLALDDLVKGINAAIKNGSKVIAWQGEWAPAAPFPTTRANGQAVKAGDAWVVTAGGTRAGVTFSAGDVLFALIDGPGLTYAGQWLRVPVDADVAAYALEALAAAAEASALLNSATGWHTQVFTGDGTQTAFTLDYPAPSASGILVFVDGVSQAPSAFSVSGAVVTFSEAVPDGSIIMTKMALVVRDVVTTHHWAPALPPTAAEIIATLAVDKRNTVSLREILGTSYTEAQDAAAILNAVMPELCAAGVRVNDPEGMTLSFQTKLFLCSGWHFTTPRTKFWRDWSREGNSGSMIATPDFDGVTLQNITWIGGEFATRSAAYLGTFMLLWANDVHLEDLRVTRYSGGRCFHVGGDRWNVRGLYGYSNDTGTGDGFFRVIGGKDWLVLQSEWECGDDGLQCVAGQYSADNLRFGYGYERINFIGGRGVSRKARLMNMAMAYSTSTPDVWTNPGSAQEINFIGIVGRAPQAWIVDGSACANVGGIDGINFIGCHVEANSDSDDPDKVSGRITGSQSIVGTVRRVGFTNCSFRDSFNDVGLKVGADGVILSLQNFHADGKVAAVRVSAAAATVAVNGGEFSTLGGTDNDRGPIIMVDSAVGSRVLVDGMPLMSGVPSNKAAVRTAAASSFIEVRSMIVQKASGATNVSALQGTNATATLIMVREGIFGDVTDWSTGAASVISRAAKASRLPYGVTVINDTTNGSRDVTQLAETVIEDSAPGVDRTHGVQTTNATKGDSVLWYRASANAGGAIIVAISGGGATLGTLTNAGDWVRILFDGTTWKVVNSSASGGGGGGATTWGSITGTLSSQSDLNTALSARELTANKAAVNGYAGLDGSAKVPLAQLPAFVEASISTNTTVASTDHLKWYSATAALTLTLPTTPATGFTIRVSSASTVTLTLAPGGTDTVDRDNLVYPGEAVELVFTGSVWRRSILRGFGRDTTSSASVLPDLDSTTTPGGTYRATTSTTNIASRPSLLGTALIVRVSRQTSSVLSQEIWDPANLSLGSWMRTYTGGAWSLWTNGGAVAYVATASRPTNVLAGARVFDTTLGRVVVWNGSAWAEETIPPSGVTAATYGAALQSVSLAIDASGRVTAASTQQSIRGRMLAQAQGVF